MASQWGTLKLPYKIVYVVTKECHSRCQNCKIWKVKPENELTLEEVRKFAAQSPFLNWINLTGGETTDRKDLVEIIQAFIDSCPNLLLVNFATNGLKPEHIENTCKRIIELKPPKFVVTVSLDGPPKVNDALRGIKGDFLAATETYQRLSRLKGMEVYIGMTLYPQNVGLIDETVAAIRERIPDFDYRHLHVNIAHFSDHYFENGQTQPRSPHESIKAVEDYLYKRGIPRTPFEWVERMYQLEIRKYLETQKTPLSCSALMSSVFVTEHGDIYPCSIWSKKMGSLRQSNYSLVPILESQLAKTTRQQVMKSQCPNCWTPCEAYQTLAAHAPKEIFNAIKRLNPL